jgi:hypothetical protein
MHKRMIRALVKANTKFLTEKKEMFDCFNLPYTELYIPSIFNKLCIKVRKTEN